MENKAPSASLTLEELPRWREVGLASLARRFWIYSWAMFPPAQTIPMLIGHCLGVVLALQALAGMRPLQLTPRVVLAILLAYLVTWLLRVYDDLKDAGHDVRLAGEGDHRYSDRPLVTGEVTVRDLLAFRGWLLVPAAVLGALLGTTAWLTFLGILGLCWLSSRWFFWPAISKNLLLAFATHFPIYFLLYELLMAVVHQEIFGPLAPGSALLLVGAWLVLPVFEVARKIRRPDDETGFQTYSKMLGWRTATLVAIAFAVISALLLVIALRSAMAGIAGQLLICGAAAFFTVVGLLFIFVESLPRSLPTLAAQLYMVALSLGLPIVLILDRGLVWSGF